MLQELSIRNFAIIEDLTIRFAPGLTILSGETGAGKSIIINAVNLLLGSRASAALVRTGAESAELEALFDLPAASPVAQAMAAAGHDPAEGLMVRRVISANERHRIYINGRLATMQALAELTARLASISGQHAHQGLLREEEHLSILDHFGELLALRGRYAEAYADLLPLIRREQELLRQQSRQGEQMELLRFQRQEIAAAAPTDGEDAALEKERLLLKNGETLFQTVQQCLDGLYAADGAVYETLGAMTKELSRVARLDDRLADKAKELEELLFRVEDIAAHLRDYLKRLDLDPQRLEAVEARLDLLNKLKRKHGGSLAQVLAHARSIDDQLDTIDHLDAHLDEVRGKLRRGHETLGRMAAQLAEQRRKAAQALAAGVEKELAALKMAGTRFAVEVQFVPAPKESNPYLVWEGRALTEAGADRACFLIAPNVGEAIKPLAAIASGGELSRVVLALKAILAQGDDLETVVFDEVDAGIGGGTAELVGRKLAALARRHQILCITHLPQIAKFGDQHLRIVKHVDQGRTRTTIAPLDARQRVEEIARMLGGEKITETTLAHAKEMLEAK
jgi:DNA repair protein RecN (Recombination protein N)